MGLRVLTVIESSVQSYSSDFVAYAVCCQQTPRRVEQCFQSQALQRVFCRADIYGGGGCEAFHPLPPCAETLAGEDG